ncbi:hypothetical protein SVIOM74S_02754 [Streptomyces violarus]
MNLREHVPDLVRVVACERLAGRCRPTITYDGIGAAIIARWGTAMLVLRARARSTVDLPNLDGVKTGAITLQDRRPRRRSMSV